MAIGKRFSSLTPSYVPITPGEISRAHEIASQLPLSEEGRDLAAMLIESGFVPEDLQDLSEADLTDLFLQAYGGRYSGGTSKNIEIWKYQKALRDAKYHKRAWPSKDLDPTDGVQVIKTK